MSAIILFELGKKKRRKVLGPNCHNASSSRTNEEHQKSENFDVLVITGDVQLKQKLPITCFAVFLHTRMFVPTLFGVWL